MADGASIEARPSNGEGVATRVVSLRLALGMVVVAACSSGIASQLGDIPVAVRRALDQPRAPVGQQRSTMVGRFEVEPTTVFCLRLVGKVGFDGKAVADALVKLGQSPYLAGAPRIMVAPDDRACRRNTKIVILVHLAEMPQSRAYTVTMAAWQGGVTAPSALWIGSMVRGDGMPRPDIFNPYNTDAKPFEIGADAASLSQSFSTFLQAGHK